MEENLNLWSNIERLIKIAVNRYRSNIDRANALGISTRTLNRYFIRFGIQSGHR